ncbi:2OG-Fe(II) oxygenase [Nocardia asteroides]|uniref:2OG-Fe(II) oxygenase n=1 Tax=Nocardia asteroides TaxID=1824 RepID=UPI001E410D25|nr:2OG-Fe(II) oxygenase [Nocardia asteroides]UGT61701.1 2OG-Fe(II) oxygenase [Nocardia asteroides]
MTDQTLPDIVELLRSTTASGSFATHGTLHTTIAVEVDGVGPLAFPVPPEQARQLRALAAPAQFGRGEQTLLDPAVRDTWKVPLDRVRVDGGGFAAVLDTVRAELGLPAGCALRAEPHSLLVYEPGQFFRRHRDSEKADGMIGTLVLTLPTECTGGELVIEHGDRRLHTESAADAVGYVAFYADCEHEVLPVTEGYRIALTYNLIATGDTRPADPPPATGPQLTAALRTYFGTPVPLPHWRRGDGPEHQAPQRLVYLLDHQYSQRGLGWDRLKGADAASAAALRAAAGTAGLAVELALTEVIHHHRTDAFIYELGMMGRRRRWEFADGEWALVDDEWESIEGDEDEEDIFGEPSDHSASDHPDANRTGADEPEVVITTLTWRLDADGTGLAVSEQVHDDEIRCATPTQALQEHAYEAEGYTGNEGDTIERWYRRAAVVVRAG